MAHRDPPGIIAPHLPADVYRRAEATGQPVVVIVHTTDHNGRPLGHYLFPLVVAGAAVMGCWGLVAALCALLDTATHAVTVIAQTTGPPQCRRHHPQARPPQALNRFRPPRIGRKS